MSGLDVRPEVHLYRSNAIVLRLQAGRRVYLVELDRGDAAELVKIVRQWGEDLEAQAGEILAGFKAKA